MATSAFKSTTRRAPIGNSPPSTDESPTSASYSKANRPNRRSRSLSRFSRPIQSEIESGVLPTPRRKFVNTVRGSDFTEISLDDLAIEFFSGKENISEVDDESGCSRSGRPVQVWSEISPVTTASQRRSRSVSRHPTAANNAISGRVNEMASSQRRGRSVSRRNDGTAANASATTRVVPNADSRRRRSISIARSQISDSENDIDFSRNSANQSKSRSNNNGISRVASFQRPTASSHRRLSRSMSQTPRLRSHDDHSSQSSALTDEDSGDAHYGKNEFEKTIRAVYAQKKIDHPSGNGVNNGLYAAMRKELRTAVNEIMIELEQEKSKQDLLAERILEEQCSKDGYKIVREVIPESKSNSNVQRGTYSRKRSTDRNRVSKRLNEEAEKYFEDFISNVEDTDFSSFDGERSDTSSTLVGTIKQRDGAGQNGSPAGCNSLPVEMEGVILPWLKWDANDGVPSTNTLQAPTTPKKNLWDPSQDLELIQDCGSSSYGSWNPAHSTNTKSKVESARFDMNKYLEVKKSEEVIFEGWRERKLIESGGLLLCGMHS